MMEDAKLYIESDPDDWKFAVFVAVVLAVAGLAATLTRDERGSTTPNTTAQESNGGDMPHLTARKGSE